MYAKLALRSLPAPQFHLQRCCGSHPGALSSSPQASTNSSPLDWLSKQLPARARTLTLLNFARRGCPDTLSNGLAEFTDWRKKTKNKTQPKHFHRSPQRALSRHSRGHSNVLCIFLGQLFFSLTWTPFPPIIRLLNSQSRAPRCLWRLHPSPDLITGYSLCTWEFSAAKEFTFNSPFSLLSLLPSLLPLLGKGEGKQSYFYHLTESQFSCFLIENKQVGSLLFNGQFTLPTQHNIHENSDGREGNPSLYKSVGMHKAIDNHPLWRFAQPGAKRALAFPTVLIAVGIPVHPPARSLGEWGALMTCPLFSSSEDLYSGIELPMLPSRDWACWGYASEESAEKMWNIFDAQGIRLMKPV